MKKTYILLSIVFAVIMLFAASEVRAGGTTPYPLSRGVAVAPRDCTINPIPGVSVHIQAGPNFDQFPIPDTCPDGPCLRWDYRWTVTGTNASLLQEAVSVDSDITVLKATPGATVSKILGLLNVGEGERFLVFQTSGTQTQKSYWTPLNATPGTLTAGFIGKKGWTPLAGRCQLAGANNVVLQANEAVPDMQSFQAPGCTVAFGVDPKGKVIPGTMQIILGEENCIIEESPTPMMIDGVQIVYTGAAQFTLPGSCSSCWVNTYGGKTCSTCTTCCINNATGKCVATSSLTAPATQCRAGTYP